MQFEGIINLTDAAENKEHKLLVRYEVNEIEDGSPYFRFANITVFYLSDTESTECTEARKKICSLNGWLALSDLMIEDGEDPHYLCDDFSADMQYVWSALKYPDMVIDIPDNIGTLFYVDSINIEPEYDTPDIRFSGIVRQILSRIILLTDAAIDSTDTSEKNSILCNDCFIDIVAYYPKPLPYDLDRYRERTDSGQYWNQSERHVHQILRDGGIRIPDETYPEKAINRPEWKMMERAGWKECGHTRLFYMCSQAE